MKRISVGTTTFWNSFLAVSVVFAAFILPLLPPVWQRSSFRVLYTLMYITAILSLEKRSKYTLLLFVSTVLMEWISAIFSLDVLFSISRAMNILFFLVIVISLIRQIASAREVTPGVILGSITGYLLMGIIYSIFIAFIVQHDPAAFTAINTAGHEPQAGINTSVPLYFSFVTMASLGYGDVLPLKPYTRSLATLIVVSGQFYIAIIVALLVGKFSAQQHTPSKS